MLENYLGYLEICIQLYTNQKENPETIQCFNKYYNILEEEYKSLSQEEKENLKEIIENKIISLKTEKATIMTAQIMMYKDKELNSVIPAHIKAQYSDKLKKYAKEEHFLTSIDKYINDSKGMSR